MSRTMISISAEPTPITTAGTPVFSLASLIAQSDTRAGDGQYGQPGVFDAGQPGSPGGPAVFDP